MPPAPRSSSSPRPATPRSPGSRRPGPDRYRRGSTPGGGGRPRTRCSQTFDVPEGNTSCVRRVRSNTPLQALTTLNETIAVEAARALARKALAEGGATDADRSPTPSGAASARGADRGRAGRPAQAPRRARPASSPTAGPARGRSSPEQGRPPRPATSPKAPARPSGPPTPSSPGSC